MSTSTTTTAYDELGAEIEPGTLCWVRTIDNSVPSRARNQRCLAVFAGAHGAQPWLLLIPDNDDPWMSNSEGGWRLNTHLTEGQMLQLNLVRFDNTHRGWWPDRSAFTFIETAIGYWCVTHQVFHAAETCPPSEYADRIAALERELAEAKEAVARAEEAGEEALEAFKVRCSDILGDAANEHDLCGQYDAVCESAGLYPREHNEDVEIEVTYRQTITVKARNYDAAIEKVDAMRATRYFAPPTPFDDEGDIEESGTPYSLTINVGS